MTAIILSAQSTDKGVNKATKALFPKVKTAKEMLELGEEGLKSYIKTIGLFNSKAKNIMELSKILVKDFGGSLPHDFASLIKLPGVGRKSANVFLNVALGLPTMPVDTHIFRISNRIGLVKSEKLLEVEERLLKLTPPEFAKNAHHLLLLHGRYICTAKKPKCAECVINKYCEFKEKA
jgi:endonuclease-3